ncbi:putative ATPase involved in replication control, Cdc46/Mcm family [Candidatus Nitrososphaera evergladensis SR1]|uniref:Putative ATPase involved in replication control, Cdc46/Mcm family n=2 Tax=Nitrososphaera TaxID=497726 RepID=A0A075MZA6_9ARCH|nr:putative ATPase involved in replication control, Cdc46/Mcm family [Candidatus Nitrososphaera evergladensis SR1]
MPIELKSALENEGISRDSRFPIDSLTFIEAVKLLPVEIADRFKGEITRLKRFNTRLIIAGERPSHSTMAEESNPHSDPCAQCDQNFVSMTISEALRTTSSVKLSVKGVIVSQSLPYKVITKTMIGCNSCDQYDETEHNPPKFEESGIPKKCRNCGQKNLPKFDYATALSIQLQDPNPTGDLERLDIILYGKDTCNVIAGELVEIKGTSHIMKFITKKLTTVLHAESIKYHRRQELKVTEKDVENIYRFKDLGTKVTSVTKVTYIPTLRERLVSMVAPNVVGHKDKKLGILLSAVGAPENGKRGRIHSLFVGAPGTAKSMLARESIRLVPNSRYVSAQGASGKSLTAIIVMENENAVLRLGSIPLSKNGICAINEIGTMSFEDQKHLHDVMEEGDFTIDKYGIRQEIDSPTTIIATCNPIGSTWNSDHSIDMSEIPVKKEVLDRFDQKFVFRDFVTEESMRDYADAKMDYDERHIEHNYNFLRKYIAHAKTIYPTFTTEAREMLKEYWISLRSTGRATNRNLDALFRLSSAYARLHLETVVDKELVIELMEYYTTMLAEQGQLAETVRADPIEVAFKEIVKVVENAKKPIEFVEAARIACKNNERVGNYLGVNLVTRENKKLRNLLEMFQECTDSRVEIIQKKPLVLKWRVPSMPETNDIYDHEPKGKSCACPAHKDEEIVIASGNSCLSVGFKKGGN